MSHSQNVVAPSLDCTGISAAFRNAGNVDLFACGEGIGGHYVTNVHIGSAIKTELFQVSLCGNARLLVMTCSRLCNQLFSDVLEAELYGIVSSFSAVFFCTTGQGPASITVTGIAAPLSAKIWVIPSFLPMIPFFIVFSSCKVIG